MEHMKKCIVPVLMLCLSFVCGIMVYLTPDRELSRQENRVLKSRPPLSYETIMSGDFQQDMETYLGDQFPARDGLVPVRSGIRVLLGVRDIHEAYIGKDGYYFEKVTEDDIDDKIYEGNLERIRMVKESCPEINVKALLVPSSGILLSDYLPAHARMYPAKTLMEKAGLMLGDSLIDPSQKLLEAREEGRQIYYRTDHHWTSQGAYAGYLAWKDEGRVDAYPQFITVADDFYGTLYARVTNKKTKADTIEIYQPSGDPAVWINQKESTLYHMDKVDEVDKYQIFLGGNYGIVDIQTKERQTKSLPMSNSDTGELATESFDTRDSGTEKSDKGDLSAENSGVGHVDDRVLLIIKDSFANCMVPFLTEDYDRILMIDPRYYPGTLDMVLKEYPVQDILFLYELNNFATDRNLVKLIRK